jgi:hypothetical protein
MGESEARWGGMLGDEAEPCSDEWDGAAESTSEIRRRSGAVLG